MENKGCCTDRNRVCYSNNECKYKGERIDETSKVCNAYEMSEGSCVCCGGQSILNLED